VLSLRQREVPVATAWPKKSPKSYVNGTDNPAVTPAGESMAASPAATARSAPRSRTRWLHHLHRAARCSHSQQHRPAHHHQRRQSRGLHHQNISVMNPIPILTSASPMAFNPGPATIVLTGQKFITGAQVLVNGSRCHHLQQRRRNSPRMLTRPSPAISICRFSIRAPAPPLSNDLIARSAARRPLRSSTPVTMPRASLSRPPSAPPTPTSAPFTRGLPGVAQPAIRHAAHAHRARVEQALIVNNPPCAAGDVKCNAALFVQNNQDEGLVRTPSGSNPSPRPTSSASASNTRSRFKCSSSPATTPRRFKTCRAAKPAITTCSATTPSATSASLLQDVTLNPMMGQFLSMLGNDKGNATTDPDENYAREVMQLFTIGLWQLNNDGTQQLDKRQAHPHLLEHDVMGLAAVFTGFSWNIPGDSSDNAWSNCCLYVGPGYGEELLPMQTIPSHHSTVEKQFPRRHHSRLRQSRPQWRSQNRSRHALQSSQSAAVLLQADDPAPGHQQSQPRLRQPRRASLQNDGTGVRGNLQAVITAILSTPKRATPPPTSQSAIRQGPRSSAPLHRMGARLHRAIPHRLL
jgi:hypothetical protein